jgi:hypothetical protein
MCVTSTRLDCACLFLRSDYNQGFVRNISEPRNQKLSAYTVTSDVYEVTMHFAFCNVKKEGFWSNVQGDSLKFCTAYDVAVFS